MNFCSACGAPVVLRVPAGDSLPRCPGAFGGTTVVVLPEGLAESEIAAWISLEADDPLAKESRSQRLRVATSSGERALPAMLAGPAWSSSKTIGF